MFCNPFFLNWSSEELQTKHLAVIHLFALLPLLQNPFQKNLHDNRTILQSGKSFKTFSLAFLAIPSFPPKK